MQKSATNALTRDEAAALLSDTARASLSRLIKVKQYIAGFDDDGNPVYQTAMTFNPTLQDIEGVAEISISKSGLKIKMRDRTAAVSQLSKMNGWDAPQKIEQTNVTAAPIVDDKELKAAVVKLLSERGLPTKVYDD